MSDALEPHDPAQALIDAGHRWRPIPEHDPLPLHLRRALVSSEDSRFGWNSGLDLFGTLRSLVRASGGGSGSSAWPGPFVRPSGPTG